MFSNNLTKDMKIKKALIIISFYFSLCWATSSVCSAKCCPSRCLANTSPNIDKDNGWLYTPLAPVRFSIIRKSTSLFNGNPWCFIGISIKLPATHGIVSATKVQENKIKEFFFL